MALMSNKRALHLNTKTHLLVSLLNCWLNLQILYYLEKVNFTIPFGDQVSFDNNGDALPIYDILNWHWLPDGGIKIQNVGVVKKTTSGGEEMRIEEHKIFWNFDNNQVFSVYLCLITLFCLTPKSSAEGEI